uniref:CDF zinc transporter n=1 Tax=Hebeloma cylindrosporum TaxID=76867 RepID=A0AA51R4Y3_HEBCY|nr:CDF zinc transporter [Hebeloma cylindrosporum]
MKSTTKLGIILILSTAFFAAEIAVGFKTKSLALIADAFHYLNDIVAYAIAFTAAYLQERGQKTHGFTYAFHRAELVGAFFNGVFLLALALSIFLQAMERFIIVQVVTSPELVLIVGCIGLVLNFTGAIVIHDGGANATSDVLELRPISPENHLIHGAHHHRVNPPANKPQANVGLVGVLTHLIGDALNNIGVIIAAIIFIKLSSPKRFYADPAASLAISFIIFAGAVPITLRAGRILLEAAPKHLDLAKVKEDLLSIPDVLSVHDLHVWHLSDSVLLASLHVCVVLGTTLEQWEQTERYLQHCFEEYGITHVTISPEIQRDFETLTQSAEDVKGGCRFPSHEEFGCSVGDLKQRKRKVSDVDAA